MNNIYINSILLIGPSDTLKNDISIILSEKLDMPIISISSFKDKYYNQLKYDKSKAASFKKEKGILGRYKYLKQFEAHHVANALEDIEDEGILSLEATETVYENQVFFNKVSEVIKKFSNIFFILPSSNLEETWKITNKIGKVPLNSDMAKLNWHLISSPCNSHLATHTIYRNDRTCDEIVAEIIECVISKK